MTGPSKALPRSRRFLGCTATPGSQPLSARTPPKLPRCLECILDGTTVGSGEIRNDHHVLDVSGRDAERLWKLSPQMVAEVEIGANYQVRIVKLPGYQSAVVPPLKPFHWPGEAHTRQSPGHARYVAHLHERGPSCSL
jgi:hypothetical protein